MLNPQSLQPTKLDLTPTNNVWVSIGDLCCLVILDPTSIHDMQFNVILQAQYLIGNPMSSSGTQFNVHDVWSLICKEMSYITLSNWYSSSIYNLEWKWYCARCTCSLFEWMDSTSSNFDCHHWGLGFCKLVLCWSPNMSCMDFLSPTCHPHTIWTMLEFLCLNKSFCNARIVLVAEKLHVSP
mgnify:CR=1 FL=1